MRIWIKNNFIDFFLISVFFLYLGYASTWVVNDVFTSVIFAIILLIFLFKRKKFDLIFYLTSFVWILINLISAIFINTHQEFSFITFIGVTMRIIMPYLIVKIIGKSFFEKIISYAYYLSLISLVIFIFQIFYLDYFFKIAPYLNFITQDEQYENGGWYIFIYMFSSWAPDRNSGFAWEPGAFACILILLISYQIVVNNFKLDKKSMVFIIALITTKSTAGFLALFFIVSSIFIYQNKIQLNLFYFIGLLVTIVFSIYFYYSSEFMRMKIETYIEEKNYEYEHATGIVRINRLEEFYRGLDQSLHWPLGNGILDSDYRIEKFGTAVGPNSLSSILMQWGWLGMIFFLYSTTKLFFYYSKDLFISILFTLSFSIVLFSNPFMMRYLIYSLFFYYFLFLKNKTTFSNA